MKRSSRPGSPIGKDMITAELQYDHQHGPIASVTVNGIKVSIYMHENTAVVTKPDGQYGLEVNGDYQKFMEGIKQILILD